MDLNVYKYMILTNTHALQIKSMTLWGTAREKVMPVVKLQEIHHTIVGSAFYQWAKQFENSCSMEDADQLLHIDELIAPVVSVRGSTVSTFLDCITCLCNQNIGTNSCLQHVSLSGLAASLGSNMCLFICRIAPRPPCIRAVEPPSTGGESRTLSQTLCCSFGMLMIIRSSRCVTH